MSQRSNKSKLLTNSASSDLIASSIESSAASRALTSFVNIILCTSARKYARLADFTSSDNNIRSSSRKVSNFIALRGYLRIRTALSASMRKTGPLCTMTGASVDFATPPPSAAALRAAFLAAADPFNAFVAMTAMAALFIFVAGLERFKCASSAIFNSLPSDFAMVSTLSASTFDEMASINAALAFLDSVALSFNPTAAKCTALQ